MSWRRSIHGQDERGRGSENGSVTTCQKQNWANLNRRKIEEKNRRLGTGELKASRRSNGWRPVQKGIIGHGATRMTPSRRSPLRLCSPEFLGAKTNRRGRGKSLLIREREKGSRRKCRLGAKKVASLRNHKVRVAGGRARPRIL